MSIARSGIVGIVLRHAARLRYPQLFWIAVALFVLDVATPDLVPFADEILLGLIVLLLGRWKRQKASHASEPPDSHGPSD